MLSVGDASLDATDPMASVAFGARAIPPAALRPRTISRRFAPADIPPSLSRRLRPPLAPRPSTCRVTHPSSTASRRSPRVWRAASAAAVPATSPLSQLPADAPSDPHAVLRGTMVHRAVDGVLVDLADQFGTPGERSVVVFMRSFG